MDGRFTSTLVPGEGFEPPKASPADLQSAPFGRSGIPAPGGGCHLVSGRMLVTSSPGGNREKEVPVTMPSRVRPVGREPLVQMR